MSDDGSLKPDQETLDYIEGRRDTFNLPIAAGSHTEARAIAEGLMDQIRELPPKWSQVLSASKCTCVNRIPGTAHFEDCPLFGNVFVQDLPYVGRALKPDYNWPQPPSDLPWTEAPLPQPLLGLATTEELLQELISRGRVESVHEKAGRAMMRDCEQILSDLPPEMRSYRTAGR